MTTLPDFLRRSAWAGSLSKADFDRVAAETLERTVPAGGSVCRKGEPVEHWVGVIEGLVKLSATAAEGKLTTLAGVTGGAWFGEGSMLKSEPRRYDALALRNSRVALMPRATFDRLLETNIAFNRFLLVQLNERLAQFIATVEYDRLRDPDARVARCLASFFNAVLYPGVGPQIAISQEEIGYLSGVSRQRVNQALQVLEKAGLLRVEYGAITILDLPGLRAFA
jgi:CRP/FNR family transcriptional regulator, cyclic AMP receptor protein